MMILNLLAGLLVLGWLVWRQTATRAFDPDRSGRGLLVLVVLGLLQLGNDPAAARVNGLAATLVAGSLVAAGAFGALRATLMRVWRTPDGRTWRAGSAASIALWLVPVALHLTVDRLAVRIDPAAAGLGPASLLLYLAVSLGAQRLVLAARGRRLAPPEVGQVAPTGTRTTTQW